jgi:hypothetical protein
VTGTRVAANRFAIVGLRPALARGFLVGTMAPGDNFPDRAADIWTPLQLEDAADRSHPFLQIVGRRRAGATLVQASAELAGLAESLALAAPAPTPEWARASTAAPTRCATRCPGVQWLPAISPAARPNLGTALRDARRERRGRGSAHRVGADRAHRAPR